MRATTLTVGPLVAASANNIALSQTPSGAFTLNGSIVTGGVAVLDTARRVLFTQAASESGKTYTIVGTDVNSMPQIELLSAAASATTVQSNLDFKTITSASISSAATGAITVGTSGVASSRWGRLDEYAPAPVTLQCTVSGTANYTVQQSLQDPNSPTNPVAPYSMSWLSSLDPSVVAATASQISYFPNAPLWVKVTLNSGSGSVSTVVEQNSAAPY